MLRLWPTLAIWMSLTIHLSLEIDPEKQLQQRRVLMKARAECAEKIQNISRPVDGVYCNMTFDNLLCWNYTVAGTVAKQRCPSYIYMFTEQNYATRICDLNGTWSPRPGNYNSTSGWTNFSQCADQGEKVPEFVREHMQRWRIIYNVGYSLSLVSLSVAMIILVSFKRLHCPRNRIHMHLFFSFAVRGGMCIFRDNALVQGVAFEADFDQATDGTVIFKSGLSHWECKMFYCIFYYSLLANYTWVMVEGIYLYILLYCDVMNPEKYISVYVIFGWDRLFGGNSVSGFELVTSKLLSSMGLGAFAVNIFAVGKPASGIFAVKSLSYSIFAKINGIAMSGNPLLLVAGYNRVVDGRLAVFPCCPLMPWVLVRYYTENYFCWNTHPTNSFWILHSIMTGSIVINAFFFLRIIYLIFLKLYSETRSQLNSLLRLVKSVLILIPLFGVQYIIIIAIPERGVSDSTRVARNYLEHIFNSFQGFVVSILFCFMNSEVQAELKGVWDRYRQRNSNFLNSRTLTSMTRDQSSSTLPCHEMTEFGRNRKVLLDAYSTFEHHNLNDVDENRHIVSLEQHVIIGETSKGNEAESAIMADEQIAMLSST